MASDDDIVGYTVAYDQDDIHFPIYVMTAIAVALFVAGVVKGLPLLAVVALLPAAVAYYNLPLIEGGRPRLGSGQYGLFIEGLGLVSWRAIDSVTTVETVMRGVTSRELHIALRKPLAEALLVDWRRRPLARRFMRLPWRMDANVIGIPLDILDRPADEIAETVVRMWRFNRGR